MCCCPHAVAVFTRRWSNRLFKPRVLRVKIANYGGFAQGLRRFATDAHGQKGR